MLAFAVFQNIACMEKKRVVIALDLHPTYLKTCDNKKKQKLDFAKLYDIYKAKGMLQLSDENKQAIQPRYYLENEDQGRAALEECANNIFEFACQEHLLQFSKDKKLRKKQDQFKSYVVALREVSLGLKHPDECSHCDEMIIKAYSVTKLTTEDRDSMQKQAFLRDKNKAYHAVNQMALIMYDELSKRNLLSYTVKKDEYIKSFVSKKIQELESMYNS